MPVYRSRTTTHGRNMSGARALWRATGMKDGDTIEIDIPNRKIHLAVSEGTLAKRRTAMEAKGNKAWKPVKRNRIVSPALRAYAAMTTSASRGAVRDVSQIER